MSPWNCSAVLDGQLYTHSRSHWPSTSAFCHSAEVGRTVLLTEQFRSSALFCGGPVDLEFAARQSSWPRTESRCFWTSAEDIHFYEILMTKCIKHIRDLFEYALYKFTLYLLTYCDINGPVCFLTCVKSLLLLLQALLCRIMLHSSTFPNELNMWKINAIHHPHTQQDCKWNFFARITNIQC